MATNINSGFVVVDASIILAELLPDEKNSPKVKEYFKNFSENKLDFIAPMIMRYEVTNTLRNISSKREITLQNKKELLKEFLSWPIVNKEEKFDDVFRLAIDSNLTVYDAAYLYLAEEYDCELLTLDKKLAS